MLYFEMYTFLQIYFLLLHYSFFRQNETVGDPVLDIPTFKGNDERLVHFDLPLHIRSK